MNEEADSEMMVYNGRHYPCCASLTMGVIGGKWKTVILFHLMKGARRYSELRKDMPTVTERTLSLQLKQLDADGIVDRKVYHKKPPMRVEYSLTTRGESLKAVVEAIAAWGDSVSGK